jgi:HlyD family secretion protein
VPTSKSFSTKIAWVAAAIILIAGAGLVVSGRASSKAVLNAQDDIPLAQVRKGDIDIVVHSTGELRTSHTMMLTAPSVGGGALQITKLLPTSTPVRKGDVVIEFDPSEQRYKLEQNRSELLQAEQEIIKANADDAVLAAQDKVAVLKAKYDVRRAQLDVQKNEISSSIDAKKNDLALLQALRVQSEIDKDLQSHRESGQASIYLAKEKYNKAKLLMDEAQQNIDKMRVVAPMDGLVSIQKNQGDFSFSGMSIPDFHTGDQANPGAAIVQIVDPLGLEMSAHLTERDANNIKAGQRVLVTFDAIPGSTFNATVKSVGSMSAPNIFAGDTGGTFDVTITLNNIDERLRAGFSAQMVFLGGRKNNVLYIPRQAVFLKDGKRIVYVKHGSSYDQQVVKIPGETESRSIVDGLPEGTQIALVDPTSLRKPSNTTSAATAGTP